MITEEELQFENLQVKLNCLRCFSLSACVSLSVCPCEIERLREHVNGLFVIKEHVYFQVWRSNCQESHHLPLVPLPSLLCIIPSVFRVMFHSLKRFLSAHHYNRTDNPSLPLTLSLYLPLFLSAGFRTRVIGLTHTALPRTETGGGDRRTG